MNTSLGGEIDGKPLLLPALEARPSALPRLTLNTIWLILAAALLLIILDLQTINPNDFWWHLRTGQIILQTHAVPNIDLFTFSRSGIAWTNQSWLTEVIFFLVYRAGGPALVVFWYALTMTAGYVFLELACLRANGGKTPGAVTATVVAAVLGLITWTVRPQAVSFALFGLLLLIIEEFRAGHSRVIWCLPVVFALWTNLHGGFVFGIGLLGVFTLAQMGQDLVAQRQLSRGTAHLLAAGLVSLLALALNPSGPIGIVQYVYGFLQSSATQTLNLEFLPLSLRESDGQLFAAFAVTFLVLLYVRKRTLPPYYVAAMLVFAVLAMQSRRILPWFGMTAAPACAWLSAPVTARRPAAPVTRRDKPALNYLLTGLLALGLLGSMPWFRASMPFIPALQRGYMTAEATPDVAVTKLCSLGPQVRVFADIAYASYLTWACPSAPFFMDTRFELYSREMWEDYLLISNGQFGWENALRTYGANTILVRKSYQKVLILALRDSDSWRIVYEDSGTVLAIPVEP